MSERHLVCQGAICSCNFGTTPDKLVVKTQSRRYINDKDGADKLMATDKDLGTTFEKNTFGSCSQMRNKPCQVTITEWSGFYDKITLEDNGGKPLLEDSKGSCPIGGKDCVVITFHGQTAEVTQKNVDKADKEVLTELCPLVDLEEVDNTYNIIAKR
ncbi:DUF4280 domain-containing protein [Myroides sp. DF42-4-2]|uniref:DUF4280 domain-containing protein n=1 Tax=Myroides sp. DF42-4-2 TaxID=2746726 RepID=UPI0025784523|nr:DUF4280 domain-containing protein [Myroides sp. DF42-4-2]MDM1409101.1 DUF4280 domain-containing protein [Myroides sp. DF42-4-2]